MEQSKFYQIKNITEHEYTLVGCNGSVITRSIQDVDKSASAFTIQDAKDGDVLVVNDNVFIYSHRKQMYSIAVAHCFIDSAGGFYLDGEFGYVEYGKTISPATKEECDLLFQKMKEKGYEWDDEKKKLKIVDWSKHVKCDPNPPSIGEESGYELDAEKEELKKTEPKFKVGDFIVNDYCVGRIVDITKDAYLLDTKQGIPFSCNSTRLYDITKDAIDGDVLVTDNGRPFIYKGCTDPDHPDSPVAYCGINTNENFYINESNFQYWWTEEKVYPVTKDQRDLLFQKMKEAGYEWDTEERELRKIEGEPKKHEQYTMSEIANSVIDFRQKPEQSNEENFDIAGLYYAKAILEKTLGKVEGYQSDDGILEHKSAINAVTKLCEQKSVEIKDAIEWLSYCNKKPCVAVDD